MATVGDTPASAEDPSGPAARVRARLADGGAGVLVWPLVLFDLLVFVVPVGYLVRLSLTERSSGLGRAFVRGSWALDGYEYLGAAPLVARVFGFTLGFAAVVTVLSVALGTLYAYAVWRSEGRLRTLLLAGVLVSMFTTLVVKLFALRLLLVPNGPVNGLLLGTGLLSEPLALVNNLTGVVLGQLYIVVPYSVLAVYSVLSSVDERTVEAARDLGASGPRAFVEVVLPHAGPGIAVATVVSFTWSVGAYAAPFLLGSNDQRTVGMEVAALLGQDFDWTAAAALAVALTVVVLGVLAAAAVGLTRRGGDDG